MTEQDYRRLFERVAPGPELVERTIEAAEGGVRPRRKRHLARRVAVIAAAAALLGGMATSFAAVKTVSPNAVTLEEWTAAGFGTPVGVSASDLGWTVTVDGVASDRWYAYILCTLSRDDGESITAGEYGFGNLDSGTSLEDGWKSGTIRWLEDNDPNDNQVPFLRILHTNNQWDVAGTTVRLGFEELHTASLLESWGLMVRGGGAWEVEFTLPAEQHVADFHPDLAVEVCGKPARLSLVRVAPLEIWLEFTSEAGAFESFNPTLETYDAEYPCLLLSDGTELSKYSGGGGKGDGSQWHTNLLLPAGRTVAPSEIVGLRIGETVCPLTLQ